MFEKLNSAIFKVRSGRGFVVAVKTDVVFEVNGKRTVGVNEELLVITAAHCLPELPPAASIASCYEKTYPDLLSLLGDEPSVFAECYFVDPIADIAVLGTPDGQVMFEEAEKYNNLLEDAVTLEVNDAHGKLEAWVMSLEGEWLRCIVSCNEKALWVEEGSNQIASGMSGSPILTREGRAIGVVCTNKGPHPRLTGTLPGWMLRGLRVL